MGYTQHWKFQRPIPEIRDGDKMFKKAVSLFKRGMKYLPEIKLGNGIGQGEPIITDTELVFNGRTDLGENSETFSICFDNTGQYQYDFCKTSRQPYDAAVCLALLCFSKAFETEFVYWSDGYRDSAFDHEIDEGWKKAKHVMAKL